MSNDLRWSKDEVLQAADVEAALEEKFELLEGRGSPADVNQPVRRQPPIVLIASLPRSGGSLLSQLFDGHPQILTHPWEMTIGYPGKTRWPEIDPDDPPATLFASMFAANVARLSAIGYRKTGRVSDMREKGVRKRLPFRYAPRAHYGAFREALPHTPRTRRQVLDAYLAGLFAAWDRSREDGTAKKWTAGFIPGFGRRPSSTRAFFEDYPDGRLIVPVRRPDAWFVSRRAHSPETTASVADLRREMRLWNQNAAELAALHERYPGQIRFVWFRDLVADRENTMRALADWLDIAWDDCLLEPTFDGAPLAPNTNFRKGNALDRAALLPAWERWLVAALTRASRRRLDASEIGAGSEAVCR